LAYQLTLIYDAVVPDRVVLYKWYYAGDRVTPTHDIRLGVISHWPCGVRVYRYFISSDRL